MRRIFLIIAVLGIVFTPVAAYAVDWIPIVPCGSTGQDSCTPCLLFKAVKNIFDLILKGITGPIAAFMIVLSGGMMLLGGGKPALYQQGKDMLTNTLIGVAIILSAWLITNVLVKSLIRGGQGDSWYEFSCPKSLSTIKPLETALPSAAPLPQLPASSYQPENIGASIIGNRLVSGGASGGESGSCGMDANGKKITCPGRCPKLAPLLKSRANAKILEAIMYNESSCRINPPSSGAGAYGLMQMKPDTANMNRAGCDVVDPKGNPITITAAWLVSDANLEKIVCVADNFIGTLQDACGSDPANIAAGYNGGPGACASSNDCKNLDSCSGGSMRKWECPWDNSEHTIVNTGYIETRNYAPKVAACAQ